MGDIAAHAVAAERSEGAAGRDALIDLAHLRELEVRPEFRLPDENDVQQLLAALEIRQDPDLLQQRQRKVLGVVDDEHGERLQRHQAVEEFVERICKIGPRRAPQPSALHIVDRHHAEVDQHGREQILARQERIGNEGAQRLPVELVQHGAAERGLASPDVSGQYDQPFAPADRRIEVVKRPGVRGTPVEVPRVGRQTEGLPLEAVIRLVAQAGGEDGRGHPASGATASRGVGCQLRRPAFPAERVPGGAGRCERWRRVVQGVGPPQTLSVEVRAGAAKPCSAIPGGHDGARWDFNETDAFGEPPGLDASLSRHSHSVPATWSSGTTCPAAPLMIASRGMPKTTHDCSS